MRKKKVEGRGQKAKIRRQKVFCFLFSISLMLGLAINDVFAQSVSPEKLSETAQSLPQDLLERGRKLYEAGQFAEAAEVWQQAAKMYESRGDRLSLARSLSNLSAALQQLGRWEEAKGAIASSLNLLTDSDFSTQNSTSILAQALNTQGSLLLATGQAENALNSWQKAAEAYEKAGDRIGVIRAQINQAQALQALGLYLRALNTLEETQQLLEAQPASLLKASGLRSLGDILRLTGNLSKSEQVLQQSLEVAKKLPSPQAIAEALFSLGNTARAGADTKAALSFYQEAISHYTLKLGKIQAQLNLLSLLVETQQLSEAEALADVLKLELTNLSSSRTSVYAQINLAQSLMKMGHGEQGSLEAGKPGRLEAGNPGSRGSGQPGSHSSISPTAYRLPLYFNNLPTTPLSASANSPEIAQLLAKAVQQARSLGDRQAEAHALGNFGGLYEQTKQWSEAQRLTQEALQLAQAMNASDIAYRWQWQLGRLLKAQGRNEEAIAAYSEAVNNLQSLRTDLVAIKQDVQFSFRESVEPVYRQMVGLLLSPDKNGGEPSQQNLQQARKVIESLQLAELDNFFRDACLNAQPVDIDKVDSKAAIFYPIILEDRLAVILSLPGQNLRYYATPLSEIEVDNTLFQLRQNLVTRTTNKFLPIAQQVYQWLIKPAEADLIRSQVKTLVFVPDGSLRNLPMAALHDGQKYVLEKYSVAMTPGLQLLEAKPLQRGILKALTAGLTESRQDFAALPNVAKEVDEIKSMVPSEVLLDAEFTSESLQKKISKSSFEIVHIATHGKFSSKADETFLLTWDGRINVSDLDRLLRTKEGNGNSSQAIELLVLSACETATGDKRAALGLAGMALRAGARSTLATLWYIDDAATVPLMSEFYRHLTNKSEVTKAEALRDAQLMLLKQPEYQHPIYWAPYILVGNWQ